ncbi:MAG TPA: PAS domain S-box protein [Candidatus Binatia bacterium]
MTPADLAQKIRLRDRFFSTDSPVGLILIGLMVGAAYYLGSLLGFALTFPNSAVSTLWPPNAILFAALLVTPTQKWWVIFCSVFPLHLLVQLQSGVSILMNLFWFVSNASEALIGAIGVRGFIERGSDFVGSRNFVIYVVVAMLAPSLSAFMDVSFISLLGWKENPYWQTWLTRLLSNVLAALTIPPLVVLWIDHGVSALREASWRRSGEAVLVGLSLLMASLMAFYWTTVGPGATKALVYLPLPFLLWAATRFGPTGASTTFLIVVVTAICGAFQGNGPFINQSVASNVLSLQLFLIVTFLPVMFVAAYVEEQGHKWKIMPQSEPAAGEIERRFPLPLLGFAVATLAFYAASYFSSLLIFPSSRLALVSLPNALLLASLLICPPRLWVVFLVSGLMAHIVAHAQLGTPGLSVGLSYFQNSTLVLVTAMALRRFGGDRLDLENLRSSVVFVAVVTAGCGLMASMWSLTAAVLGPANVSAWLAWRHAFLSNLLPFLILTPAIVLGLTRGAEIIRRASLAHWSEVIVLGAGLLGCGIGVFGLKSQALGDFPALFYVPLLFLLWAAVRFGPLGLSLSFALFALMAIVNALLGHGPFVTESPADNIFWLQLFLIIVYVPLLLLAALFEERREKLQALRETENRFRSIADAAPLMIWLSDRDNRCTFFSKGWLDFTGRSLEQELGRGWSDGVHPEDSDRRLHNCLFAFEHRQEFTIEYRLRRRDGEYRWILDNGTPRFAPDGTFLGYLGSATDITGRKETEEALRQSEERYRLLAETATDAIITMDQHSIIRFCNGAAERIFGYASAELVGQKITLLMPEELCQRHEQGMRRFLETGEKRVSWKSVSFPARHKSGRQIIVEISFAESTTGDRRLFSGIIRDITERKRAESRLNTQYGTTSILSESASMTEAAPKVIQSMCECLDWEYGEVWEINAETNLLTYLVSWHSPLRHLAEFSSASRAFTFALGVGMPGRVWESRKPTWIVDVAGDGNFPRASLAARAGLHTAFGFPILRGDETFGVMVFFSNEIREPDEAMIQMTLNIGSQMGQFAERKRAEAALRDSEGLRRAIFESEPECVKVVAPDGRLLDMNPAGLAMIEADCLEQVAGQAVLAIVAPEWRAGYEEFHDRICRGEKGVAQFEIIGLKGKRRWMEAHGAPLRAKNGNIIAHVAITHDITERKQAEEALRRGDERFQLVLRATNDVIFDWNMVTDSLWWNENGKKIYGYAPEEGQYNIAWWVQLLHPEDRDWATNGLNTAINSGAHGWEAEYRIRRSNGSYAYVHKRGFIVRDDSGKPLRMIGSIMDITDRKQAEEELKAALADVQRLKERLEAENVYLRSEVLGAHRHGQIIGESEAIAKVLAQLERIAGTDMTVLVLGETGSGKELVARAIHEKSGRRERPLVKVNCSTLPAELIESELFGHERGAFTGVVSKQVGRFELADRGTIFLDEVGELPLRLQAKLLRVLQEGEFERLGSAKTIKVDVRVIAATNRNLSEAMQRGRFRSDLYYRLNVYPIQVPPLREHREDIGLLAEVFLEEAGRRLGKSFAKIPARGHFSSAGIQLAR